MHPSFIVSEEGTMNDKPSQELPQSESTQVTDQTLQEAPGKSAPIIEPASEEIPRKGSVQTTEQYVAASTKGSEGSAIANGDSMGWAARIVVAWVYPVIGLLVLWFAKRDFVTLHWVGIAAVFPVLAVLVSLPGVQRAYRRATAQRRIGLIIFSLIPLIILFFVLVFLLDTKYQTAVLRTIFLIVVCSLPALLYYLFIATKKSSLLNEFVINLSRLGLRDPKRVPRELVFAGYENETDDERKDRIYTYIQKFEAVYGAVPTNLSKMLLSPTSPGLTVQESKGPNADAGLSIFTVDTTIPVIVATVLMVLGWLITLPPWQGRLHFGQTSTQKVVEAQSNKSAAQPSPSPSTASETQILNQSSLLPSGSPTGSPSPSPSVSPSSTPVTIDAATEWLTVYTPISSPVRFAFLGAYFFALQLLFRRYIRRDLRASAYVAVSLRVIISVITIWVAVEVVAMAPESFFASDVQKHTAEKFLLVLGFVIGVFPRVGWQVIQSAAKRIGSIVVPSLETQLPLRDLDGLTVWHEARFEEEDIENIPNMATADLVDLFINTRFSADRIIDWVDQAILYTHLGPDPEDDTSPRKHLAHHGIRNATSLVEGYNSSKFHQDTDAFEQIVPVNGRITIRSLVDAVGTNPNLKLIQTWKGLMPHVHSAPREG
jgi:hypothetical protein